MRKTNKQSTRLADDKKGVILITILFIVAVALIFITTSLMISIAARQRVYSNAQSDQARLTVTSLSQSLWQAIYAQQITDQKLEELANAGSCVLFSCSDVPGMNGAAGTSATAYFYVMGRDAADRPNKIGIECKCQIGDEVQYYTLVLKRNTGEGTPHPMFNMTVELGGSVALNSCTFGIDASKFRIPGELGCPSQVTVNGHNRSVQIREAQTQYIGPEGGTPVTDNIVFMRSPTGSTSNRDGSGFYCQAILAGQWYLRDAVFTDDVYIVGENSFFDFDSTSQTGRPAFDSGRGDAFFWGTNLPFTTTQWSASTSMPTFNNIYFDYRTPDSSDTYNPSSAGFTDSRRLVGYDNAHPWQIEGSVFYESGGTGAFLSSIPANGWEPFSGDRAELTSIEQNFTVDPSLVDTVSEVTDSANYGTYADPADSATSPCEEITDSTTAIGGSAHRCYYIAEGTTINKLIDCDVSGGDIYIYVRGNITIASNGTFDAGFIISEAAEHNVYFIVESGEIKVSTTSCTDTSGRSGFIDTRCFTNSDYANIRKLNQTVYPRFYIFAGYTGGAALHLGDTASNGGVVCTAFIGFYPSTEGGTDGCSITVENCSSHPNNDFNHYGIVYYGRIAAGGISNSTSGSNFNIPYCPGIDGDIPIRNTAYRDNTDYSVVADECQYFSASA